MKVFISPNEDNSDLMNDVSDNVSLGSLLLISNLNKQSREEDITWKFNNRSQHVSIRTRKQSYILQIPFSLGSLSGLQESDVEFVNTMTSSHELEDTLLYNQFGLKNILMSWKQKIIFQYMSY